jgi:peptidoglycan/xylan/chitin deacetylase (PgdA/CDA1 family)
MTMMINRLLKLCIAIPYHIANKVCRIIYCLWGKELRKTLIILTYHAINTSSIPRFEKQMDMILDMGAPVSLDGDLCMLPGSTNIAVTFDDGYQSVFQNALPILENKRIPATIFITTGCLGKKPMWVSNINHCLAAEIVLTNAQLKALPSDLVTVGSHTVSHINLNSADAIIAKKEIFESKETIEKLLGRQVTLFAAPYGMLNDEFVPLFKEAGYKRVFLNIPSFPASKIDLYVIGRVAAEPTDWSIEYYLKLSGSYQWLPLAINLKKRLIVLQRRIGFRGSIN